MQFCKYSIKLQYAFHLYPIILVQMQVETARKNQKNLLKLFLCCDVSSSSFFFYLQVLMEMLISEVCHLTYSKYLFGNCGLSGLDASRNGFMKGVLGLVKYIKFIIGHRSTSSPLVYPCQSSLSRVNFRAPTAYPWNIAYYLRGYQ